MMGLKSPPHRHVLRRTAFQSASKSPCFTAKPTRTGRTARRTLITARHGISEQRGSQVSPRAAKRAGPCPREGDADDLAQETFVRAYQALGRFRVGEPLHPWLARIATNLAL